ncbi:MAG: signal peptidase II [Clostridia bacterium]|nr:signal peptidase II [Clostridia bacterium]
MKINGKEIEIFKKKRAVDYVIYSLVIVVGIILDQLSKLLVVKHIPLDTTVPLIKDVLHMTHIRNDGAAFGMLDDHRWIFIAISTVTIIALAFYLYLGHAQNNLYAVSIAMIISGGIGNMIDRLVLGYVVDFIDFRAFDFWKWIFNGADSFVCIGAGMLILALILDIIKEYKATGKVS